MSEAAFRVDLKCRRQVQYELHDDGLVGHLLHQGVFLERSKKEQRLRSNVADVVPLSLSSTRCHCGASVAS